MPERQSRGIVANEPSNRLSIMTVERGTLLRFMTLYAALFSAFGSASPFMPAFLASYPAVFESSGILPWSSMRPNWYSHRRGGWRMCQGKQECSTS
jgi:hypothetical protein